MRQCGDGHLVCGAPAWREPLNEGGFVTTLGKPGLLSVSRLGSGSGSVFWFSWHSMGSLSSDAHSRG